MQVIVIVSFQAKKVIFVIVVKIIIGVVPLVPIIPLAAVGAGLISACNTGLIRTRLLRPPRQRCHGPR